MSDRQSVFTKQFRQDLSHWVTTDRKTALRILKLTEVVMRTPHSGMGKPEPLKYVGEGIWSRRITREHRLVYQVEDERIVFLQCRYHY